MLTEISNGDLTAFQSADREQCGLILAVNGEFSRLIEVVNVHPEPEDNFAICFADYESVRKAIPEFGDEGEEIVGFIHTHLSHHTVEPSKNDLAGSLVNPKFLNVIYKPSTGEFASYKSGKRLDNT